MKFGISEKNELMILKDWRDNYSYSKVPEKLKKKVKDKQTADLLIEFTKGSEIDYQKINDRIVELENKCFSNIFKKRFKEETAKYIVWIIMSFIGFVLGFLVSYFLK